MITPFSRLGRPVYHAARAGQHTGFAEYESSKEIPIAASRSIAGVRACGHPHAETVSACC